MLSSVVLFCLLSSFENFHRDLHKKYYCLVFSNLKKFEKNCFTAACAFAEFDLFIKRSIHWVFLLFTKYVFFGIPVISRIALFFIVYQYPNLLSHIAPPPHIILRGFFSYNIVIFCISLVEVHILHVYVNASLTIIE